MRARRRRRDRAVVDDPPAAWFLRLHDLQRLLRAEKGAGEVGGDDLVPVLERQFLHRNRRSAAAGIVHQEVEPPEFGADRGEQLRHLIGFADVAGNSSDLATRRTGDLRRGCLQHFQPAAGDDDGVGIRLPTICIRPGTPNKAASGFFSNILREPLAGKEAVLPVSENVRHWFASPRSAVGFFLHAATMDTAAIGPRRNLTMPGLSALVGEEIEALRRVAGEKAVKLIRREPDPVIDRIVSGWATDFDARRAAALGFRAETSFDEIIRIHIEDELGGKV